MHSLNIYTNSTSLYYIHFVFGVDYLSIIVLFCFCIVTCFFMPIMQVFDRVCIHLFFMWGGRKVCERTIECAGLLEYTMLYECLCSLRLHTGPERICKLHTKRAEQHLNQYPSYSEVTVLTTAS